MRTNDFVLPLVMGMVFVFLCGILVGRDVGNREACKSIHTEWLDGKCMRVTREEVK